VCLGCSSILNKKHGFGILYYTEKRIKRIESCSKKGLNICFSFSVIFYYFVAKMVQTFSLSTAVNKKIKDTFSALTGTRARGAGRERERSYCGENRG
jgi:hypothetical protein